MPAAALCLALFFGYSLYVLLRSQNADFLARRAHAMLQEAGDKGDERAAELLARCCAECNKIVAGSPNHAFAWHIWGSALWNLGQTAKVEKDVAKADRLFAAAEDKFVSALAVRPDDNKLTVDLLRVRWNRAELHPGAVGIEHLERICDECERLLIVKPDATVLLNLWGGALSAMGHRVTGEEADRLYAAAEEKYKEALRIAPDQVDSMSALGILVWRRAKLRRGAEANELLMQAGEWMDTALRLKPSDARALSGRAWILFARTRLMPCADTARLLDAAASQFAAVEANGDDALLRQARGVLLWARARCAEGEQATQLLHDAKSRLEEADHQEPGSAAYNLACVCAQLGDGAACREWLERSREPGILVSREQMAAEEELAAVRGSDWFRELLG